MELCQKPRVISKNLQLLDKFFSGPLNAENDKKWQKESPILNEKIGLKTILWTIFGHVWAGIFMPINFPPTLITYYTFLGQKCSIDFSPDFSHFSPTGRLLKAIQTPWKWFLRVPWWNTLHNGPRKAPKRLLTKKLVSKFLTPYTSPMCSFI